MDEERLAQFSAAWTAQDLDAVMAFFAEDCVYLASFGPERDGTAFRGRDAVREGIRAFMDTFPDGRYEDLQAFVAGNRGATQWTFIGTRRSGEVVVYRGADLFEFENDLITRKDAFRKELAPPLGRDVHSQAEDGS